MAQMAITLFAENYSICISNVTVDVPRVERRATSIFRRNIFGKLPRLPELMFLLIDYTAKFPITNSPRSLILDTEQ
jgi:hypothetical protein